MTARDAPSDERREILGHAVGASDATEREVPDENPGGRTSTRFNDSTDGSLPHESQKSTLAFNSGASTPKLLSSRGERSVFSPRSLFPVGALDPLSCSFHLSNSGVSDAHTRFSILPFFLASFVHLRRRRGGVPARCKRNSSLLHAGVGPFPTLRDGVSRHPTDERPTFARTPSVALARDVGASSFRVY